MQFIYLLFYLLQINMGGINLKLEIDWFCSLEQKVFFSEAFKFPLFSFELQLSQASSDIIATVTTVTLKMIIICKNCGGGSSSGPGWPVPF